MNVVLVTTGGGFSMPEIDPYLIAAIGDMEKPLPANPAGVARLQAVVAELAKPPAPTAVPPLPEIAHVLSGQTFVFEPNPLQLRSMRLDFSAVHQAEAIFTLDLASEQGPRIASIGLDGIYRPSQSGRPVVARGSWTDASTFAIDYSEGPGLTAHTIRLRFDGDQVDLDLLGFGSFKARCDICSQVDKCSNE
jgi:hypothetical protein